MVNRLASSSDINQLSDDYVSFAEALLPKTREIISYYFRNNNYDIISKEDESPVTLADRKVEEVIRQAIEKTYPTHSIKGEELGDTIHSSPYTWIIDPIDGTKSFISGMYTFGTLLALCYEDDIIFGMIDQPIIKDLWMAKKGEGCFFNGQRISSSLTKSLKDSILTSTSPDLFTNDQLIKFRQVSNKSNVLQWGGDCYGFGLLANGQTDLVIEAGLQFHDLAAIIPIVQEAGGIVTNWSGEKINLNTDGTVVAASTKELHEETLSLLNQ